ncbi:carboxylating nicotinate-nucleotide diphosphorylase [Cryomorpha ignava]|uniref:Probable nicotinate-nucleotide pyrophosphorylase [carboxylating] n=1 Tax=Cryomorpha ignava TaxID=101383 RepID=A0A7K3WQT0_9FLAO|nr:carboxylating nicotinate-nucleotide diphosphorylase [Cryomorpha ignava]NEN24033.1 carboxylating nicotinate-nucleotide diphosphorylase [Cryomorpha ignava]
MTTDEFIRNAIIEDIGDGDFTSEACIPADAVGRARMLIKEHGILAGTGIAESIFLHIDPSLQVKTLIADGSAVKVGDVVMTVSGSARGILKAERLALNSIQRMSGIATLTNKVVKKLEGLKTKVLDTRKTTPGIRFLEKLAVKAGGGENHRFGLYDMMMIKDNHIDYAGSIENAINLCDEFRKQNNLNIKLEVEARNLEEVDRILAVGKVDRIMLDNFSYPDLLKAVKKIGDKYETEASGNITIETARNYAECGVDFISMGALTHSARVLDISLKAY